MTIIPASSRYYAIVPAGDDDFKRVPVIAFECRTEGVPQVITTEGRPAQFALEYPNGRVFSPSSGDDFEKVDSFMDTEGFGDAPIAAPGYAPNGTDEVSLRDLGISGRACAPLAREGILTLGDLSDFARADIAEAKGVSRDSLDAMETHLHAAGFDWAGAVQAPGADVDDDLSEVL